MPYPLRAPRHQITGGITNKQDIKESQELLQSAEDMMERRRQRVERFGLAPSESYGSTGRALSFCALVSKKERARLKGTSVENCDKDLFAIAGIGDIRKRTAVISALCDPDNPASSLQEAQECAGLDRHKLERVKQKRAQSMRRDWMSADPETLSKFLELLAEWDHELTSVLLGAVRLAVKSWEES